MARKLSKRGKLFLKAYHYNWDSGVKGLQRMLRNKECDLATAKLIYWLGVPGYYNRYDRIEQVPEHERPVFEMLRWIERAVAADRYTSTIAWTPPDASIPDPLGTIPVEMTRATDGDVQATQILEGDAQEKAFFHALAEGDLDRVKALMAEGCEATEKVCGYTPISISCSRGYPEIFALLVEAGANPRARFNRSSLLHAACTPDGIHVFDALLAEGVSVNVRGESGQTPLLHAVHRACTPEPDFLAVVQALVARGASPEMADTSGMTPLKAAAGNPEVLARLTNTEPL